METVGLGSVFRGPSLVADRPPRLAYAKKQGTLRPQPLEFAGESDPLAEREGPRVRIPVPFKAVIGWSAL